MSYIRGTDRSEVLLFPEAIEDYIGDDNPVRFIDAFVSSLDLAELGFARTTPAATGRPAYDPADLLKLYIYGYLNRQRSSRMLEREAGRNVGLRCKDNFEARKIVDSVPLCPNMKEAQDELRLPLCIVSS